MTADIPSTDVIRHFVAWTYTADCPEEFIEHDPERVRLFDAWLKTIVKGETA